MQQLKGIQFVTIYALGPINVWLSDIYALSSPRACYMSRPSRLCDLCTLIYLTTAAVSAASHTIHCERQTQVQILHTLYANYNSHR